METTLEITSYCEHECDYCSTNGKADEFWTISKEEVELFLSKFPPGAIERINISGGEPLAHPEFYKILRLAERYCNDVRIYSNAIKHLIFNADVLERVKVEANVCVVPGRSIRIPDDVEKVHLLKFVPQGRGANIKEVPISVSSNFYGTCKFCNHVVLQADGQVAEAPCKKRY